MTTLDSVISFEKVSFYRGQRCIYNKISCHIPKGKITAILGPSGTGKTTLLHLIGGLLKPQEGVINVLGHNLCQLSEKQLMDVRKNMGVLFQSGALFTQLDIFNNVAFPLRQKLPNHDDKRFIDVKCNQSIPKNLIDHIVHMKLEAVGLRGITELMPNELSGGMARRAALARAIALDPEIMMYDEPFTGQDPISLQVILKLIKTLNQSLNMTSIIVSHDIDEVLSIADHVIIIADKGIAAEGSPNEVRQHKSAFIQQFLKGEADGPLTFHYPTQSFSEQLFGEKS